MRNLRVENETGRKGEEKREEGEEKMEEGKGKVKKIERWERERKRLE